MILNSSVTILTKVGYGITTSSGVNNLAVGHKALYAQTYQEDNVAVGGSAMAACNNNSTFKCNICKFFSFI